MSYLPKDVREVLREFPGIHVVRAKEIVADRKRMRRLAIKQARQRRYGPLHAGGIGRAGERVIDAIEGGW